MLDFLPLLTVDRGVVVQGAEELDASPVSWSQQRPLLGAALDAFSSLISSYDDLHRTPTLEYPSFKEAPPSSPLATPRPPSSLPPSLTRQTMHLNRDADVPLATRALKTDLTIDVEAASSPVVSAPTPAPVVEWDWDVEHADRALEREADKKSVGAGGIMQGPLEVDRRVLRDVVKEKMLEEVGRIVYLSAGTFNKAYLVTLVSGRELVARVSRRYMPRLKTASEVATMHYLRTRTDVPVPEVYAYDANPYNRLGGEYILMSKAQGIPLSQVFQSMPHGDILKIMDNAAALIVPLFGHRFDKLGSLYFDPAVPDPVSTPRPSDVLSSQATPRPALTPASTATPRLPAFSAPRLLSSATLTASLERAAAPAALAADTVVGPIVSWPFFGSGRGDLQHPGEIERGPWASAGEYLFSCAKREVAGVIRENEGKAAPHRLHLDPDEIESSRRHHLAALEGDASDESTEWDWEESECERDGPGDNMYSDYRRMQRTTFLVAHTVQRKDAVIAEMERWVGVMERLGVPTVGGGTAEQFAMDCHDLNLENVFVDPEDHTRITCIIDWESTTIRPLWASAHLPAFAQPSPFTAKLFRLAVSKLAASTRDAMLAAQANEWLHWEDAGARLRAAHRCVEWDGWEEGLVTGILGAAEDEEEAWFKAPVAPADDDVALAEAGADESEDTHPMLDSPWAGVPWEHDEGMAPSGAATGDGSASPPLTDSRSSPSEDADEPRPALAPGSPVAMVWDRLKRAQEPAPSGGRTAWVRADEREKERVLNEAGDACGGRGGELGRRLEAWVYAVNNGLVED